jgi:hypothetical protein
MEFKVYSGSDTEYTIMKVDTAIGASTLQMGDPGTNHVQVSEGGAISFVGSASINLPNDTVTPNDVLSTGQTDEYALTYEATGGTWEWTPHYIGVSHLALSMTQTTDRYLATNNASSCTSFYGVPAPGVNATLGNLMCRIQNAPGSGESRAMTVYSGCGSTSVTCTISDTATTCSDTSNTATTSASNDYVHVFVDNSAGVSNGPGWTTCSWTYQTR